MEIETKSKEQLMRDLVQETARQTAREAVKETLLSLGINCHNPQDIKADMLYLNRLRRSSEFMSSRILSVIIAVVIPVFLYLLWEAIVLSIQK